MSILYIIIIGSVAVSALCLGYIIFEKVVGKKRIDKLMKIMFDNN
jgi:hypothetical protein